MRTEQSRCDSRSKKVDAVETLTGLKLTGMQTHIHTCLHIIMCAYIHIICTYMYVQSLLK